jgi:hypothetical protein
MKFSRISIIIIIIVVKISNEEFVFYFQDYCQPLSKGGRLSSNDAEKIGASLYRVAFLIDEISKNRDFYKTILQVSVHKFNLIDYRFLLLLKFRD